MKKTRSKREPEMEPEFDAGFRSGLSSAVLDAPEEGFALKESTGSWQGRGPAPAGALQRGYSITDNEIGGYSGPGIAATEEPEYIPRRGSFRQRLGGVPKSVAGRIVLGVVVFGALGAVAVSVLVARSYFLHDERFLMATSDDIEILGDAHLSRPQVLGVFAGDLQRNIFRVPLGERRADLERLPWVAHATVMRLLPNRIRVSITERTPVAFVRQGSQIGLVDAGGVLLDMPPEDAGDPQYSFPVLTGISANDLPAIRAARMEVYTKFIKELDGPGERLTNSLSEVDVSNPEDVKALVASGSTDILVHFGDEAFLARYREFMAHLPEWKQQYPKLASADMRYEGQIVLEMQGGAGVPVAGAGDATAVAEATAKPASVAPPQPIEKPKPVAVKPAVITPAVAKPVPVDLGVSHPAASKPVAVPVALKPAVAKPAPAKKASAPLAAKSARAKAGKSASGKSASNEKVFAALAAARKKNAAAKGGATP